MALIEKRIAFFDVDNTLLKGSTIFFLGRGMYQRGFFTKKDISAFVLANIRYRLTGKENKDEIARFQNAATEFIKGHNVIEIEKIDMKNPFAVYNSKSVGSQKIETITKNEFDSHLSSFQKISLSKLKIDSTINLLIAKVEKAKYVNAWKEIFYPHFHAIAIKTQHVSDWNNCIRICPSEEDRKEDVHQRRKLFLDFDLFSKSNS